MSTIGHQVTTDPGNSDKETGFPQVAIRMPRVSNPARLIRLGEWNGNSGTTIPVDYTIYLLDPTANYPTTLIARSNRINITNAYAGAARNNEATLRAPNSGFGRTTGAGTSVVFVKPDLDYALGHVDYGPTVNDNVTFGNTQKVSGAYSKRRRIPGVVAAPSDPFGAGSTRDVGKSMAVYGVMVDNRPPTVAVTSPTNGSAISTLTPTIGLTFTDPDRTDGYEDFPTIVTIQFYEAQSGGFWQPINTGQTTFPYTVNGAYVPPTGTGAIALSIPYTAGGLQYGHTYGMRVQVQDELGAVAETGVIRDANGLVTGFTYQVSFANAGYADTITPAGKQASATVANVTGTYRHPSNVNLAQYQVRLLRRDSGGNYSVLATGPLTSIVATPGTVLSQSWATTTFPALALNTDYATEWRFIDANGVDSGFQSRTDFHTNYAPTQPSNLAPNGSTGLTAPPLITFDMTDPDDVAPTLTAQVEISGPVNLNGTFDVDASGWSAVTAGAGQTSTFARATDAFRSGSGSGKFTITADTGALGALSSVSYTAQPAVAGYQYTRSGYGRTSVANVQPIVGIGFLNGSGVLIGSITWSPDYTPTINTFELSSVTATAPAGTATIVTYLGFKNKAASPGAASVWFDDVTAVAGARYLRTATKAATGNQWQYQSITADFSLAGAYTVRARGTDAVQSGPWSNSAAVNIATAPATIVITSPAAGATLANNQPPITWTVTGATQNRYRLLVWLGTGGTSVTDAIYDSGYLVGSAVRSLAPAAGFLHNGTTYRAQIWVEDTTLAVATSPYLTFTVSYAAPNAPANFAATQEWLEDDEEASAIRLEWTPVDTAPSSLIALELYRQDPGDPSPGHLVVSFPGYDPGMYLDAAPPSGVDFVYNIRQRVWSGTDIQTSAVATATARIDLVSMILCEADDPETFRVPMRWWTSRDQTWNQDQSWSLPAGGSVYEEAHGNLNSTDLDITWRVVDTWRYGSDLDVSADELLANFRELWDRHNTLIFRDATGKRILCKFSGDVKVRDRNQGAAKYEVSFQLRQLPNPEAVIAA